MAVHGLLTRFWCREASC